MPYLHKQNVKTLHQAVLLLTSMHINYLSLELLTHSNPMICNFIIMPSNVFETDNYLQHSCASMSVKTLPDDIFWDIFVVKVKLLLLVVWMSG